MQDDTDSVAGEARARVQDTDNLSAAASEQTSEGLWPYLGVGCMTAIVGFFGTGMIAILIAKVVGGLTGCASDAETGAPCNWFTYMMRGALLGMVILPSLIVWRMRKARRRQQELRVRG